MGLTLYQVELQRAVFCPPTMNGPVQFISRLHYLQDQSAPITHIPQTPAGTSAQQSGMLLEMQVSTNSSQRKPVVEAGQRPLLHLCAPVPAIDLMGQFCQSVTMKVLTYLKTFMTREMVSISIQFYIHIWKILQVTTQNKCFNWYDILNYLKKIMQWEMWENSILNTWLPVSWRRIGSFKL